MSDTIPEFVKGLPEVCPQCCITLITEGKARKGFLCQACIPPLFEPDQAPPPTIEQDVANAIRANMGGGSSVHNTTLHEMRLNVTITTVRTIRITTAE